MVAGGFQKIPFPPPGGQLRYLLSGTSGSWGFGCEGVTRGVPYGVSCPGLGPIRGGCPCTAQGVPGCPGEGFWVGPSVVVFHPRF